MTDTIFNTKYSCESQYLETELARIDAMLKEQIHQARSRDNFWQKDDLRGLYVSETEISSLLLTKHLDRIFAHDVHSDHPSSTTIPLTQKKETTNQYLINSKTICRLERVSTVFKLTPFEKDILLLCLLPELDLDYERIFGYVQDDITRRRPSVALALKMLCSSPSEKISGRKAFSSESSLIRYCLISLQEEASRKNSPLLAKSLKIDERIRDYLLGFNEIDSNISSISRITTTGKSLDEVILPDEMKTRLVRLITTTTNGYQPLIYFQGAVNSGKQTIAEALCHHRKMSLLVVDTPSMLQAQVPFEASFKLVCREGMLQPSPIYFQNFDVLFNDSYLLHLKIAIEELTQFPGLVFLAGYHHWTANQDWFHRPFFTVDIPAPDYNQRKLLWQNCLNGKTADSDSMASAMASKFRMNSGQIYRSAIGAGNLALYQNGGTLTNDELYQSCRQTANQKLIDLAHKIEPTYTWDDIVIPIDQLKQLKEICSYVKYRHIVYGEWGFDRKFSLGKGLNALFFGPSGTGKTMAADIVARELNLDLYKIDLSMVVSKYIGETEKNLSRIFREAQDCNAILFFDEAESLFGKRSEVRDSHDRYANIEIAYLLQKMEEYDGIAILATNLHKNLDEAFARRLHFSIEFPFPEEEYRYQIWEKVFPNGVPLRQNIDLAFMARQFKIAGGNIRNIALHAAFLAAENNSAISMEYLIIAAKREYQKMGKLCTEADFDEYFNLIKA